MKDNIREENIYVDDTIVIEDEFSTLEDSRDREFYQQLVSESLSNDLEVCKLINAREYDLIKYRNIPLEGIDVQEEYIESKDNADREFYFELINQSLSDDSITTEYVSPKVINIDGEEELDVGSVADNSSTVLSISPVSEGIKTRLRIRRPTNTSNSGDNTPEKKKPKLRHHNSSVTKKYEQEKNEVRIEHNDKERQRRGDLRHSFDELRVLVPAVAGDERASKVLILSHATTYCQHLRAEFQARQNLVLELCQHQKRLRQRVDKLRKIMMT